MDCYYHTFVLCYLAPPVSSVCASIYWRPVLEHQARAPEESSPLILSEA